MEKPYFSIKEGGETTKKIAGKSTLTIYEENYDKFRNNGSTTTFR